MRDLGRTLRDVITDGPLSYRHLGYGGLLPFIAFALALFLFTHPEIRQFLAFGQIIYAGLILSFLGGVIWAHALQDEAMPESREAMIVAMIPTIASLFLVGMAALTGWVSFVLILMGAAFPAMFWIERRYLNQSRLPSGYGTMRFILTFVVAICLWGSGFSFWITGS